VELLLVGVPLDRVSILLGHGSIKVTEKHHAPWVNRRLVSSHTEAQPSLLSLWLFHAQNLIGFHVRQRLTTAAGPLNLETPD
jgi:hypothetical protein